MALHIQRALTMTPRKMASDLRIPRRNLAQFRCATICPSTLRLFLFPPKECWLCHVCTGGRQNKAQKMWLVGGLQDQPPPSLGTPPPAPLR